MSSPRFQLAFDECVIANLFDGPNVGDGSLFGRIITSIGRFATAVTISSIPNQNRVKGLFPRMSMHYRMVSANNSMVLKGFAERLGNTLRSCKNHQTTRVAVQAVNCYDRVPLAQSLEVFLCIGPMGARISSPVGPFSEAFVAVVTVGLGRSGPIGIGVPSLGLEMMDQGIGDKFLERRLQLPPFSREVSLLKVANACDSRRFFYYR